MTDTATLHLRTLAAVALFAEGPRAQTHRPQLRGVNITTERHHTTYVATDGAALLAVRRPAANTLLGSWIIPADKVAVLKAPARGADEAELSVTADGWMQIMTPDGSRVPFQPIDMPFPGWRAAVPHSPTNEPAAYDPDYLARMHKAAKLGNLGEVQMTQNGELYPAIFTFAVAGEDALGLVMPLRRTATATPYREAPVIPGWAFANA